MAREWAGGGSLVDLGTGTGYLLDLADGIFEERVGLDVSLGMMGQNRNPAVVLIRADLMRSPFVDGSFHVVASNGVLQMLADPAAFIREAARLLKPSLNQLEFMARCLAEAARRREIVARLRDRIEAEERREADRREAERLGDIASARHVRELLAQADR